MDLQGPSAPTQKPTSTSPIPAPTQKPTSTSPIPAPTQKPTSTSPTLAPTQPSLPAAQLELADRACWYAPSAIVLRLSFDRLGVECGQVRSSSEWPHTAIRSSLGLRISALGRVVKCVPLPVQNLGEKCVPLPMQNLGEWHQHNANVDRRKQGPLQNAQPGFAEASNQSGRTPKRGAGAPVRCVRRRAPPYLAGRTWCLPTPGRRRSSAKRPRARRFAVCLQTGLPKA